MTTAKARSKEEKTNSSTSSPLRVRGYVAAHPNHGEGKGVPPKIKRKGYLASLRTRKKKGPGRSDSHAKKEKEKEVWELRKREKGTVLALAVGLGKRISTLCRNQGREEKRDFSSGVEKRKGEHQKKKKKKGKLGEKKKRDIINYP